MTAKKTETLPASALPTASRRNFFIGAAAITGAAVVLAKTPVGQKVVADVKELVAPKKHDGYQLTDHVQKYYSTTLI